MSLDFDLTSDGASLLLFEEQVSIARRRREGDTVRVSTVTKATEKHVAEELSNERIEVEHVAIGRHIDTVVIERTKSGEAHRSAPVELAPIARQQILKE